METRPFHWGILGAAQIARKNWKAIFNSGNGIVRAVASRTLERSQHFIQDCQRAAPFVEMPRALGSYEELLSDPDIDGVYIPLPTGIRKEWVVRTAEAGKHIVCEKPCGSNVGEVLDMIQACQEHKVQFMDGVMFMHSQRLDQIRKALDDGETVGKIRRINSAFSFSAPEDFFASNIRAKSNLEPLGCLGDLGWYCIRFALWVMNWQTPREVTGRLLSQSNDASPVPTEFSGELLFDEGVSAGFYCSFLTELQQWADVSGSRGNLRVADFVLPYFGSELKFETQRPMFNVSGCDFHMEPRIRQHTVGEYSDGHSSSQETNLFRNFAVQARLGTLNATWPEMALKTQQVMEACLKSARQDGRPTLVQG